MKLISPECPVAAGKVFSLFSSLSRKNIAPCLGSAAVAFSISHSLESSAVSIAGRTELCFPYLHQIFLKSKDASVVSHSDFVSL